MILNIIFPIFMLWLFPSTWLFIIIANFIIDLTVVYFTCRYLHIEKILPLLKKSFIITYLGGFAVDFIGNLILIFLPDVVQLFNDNLANNLSYAIFWNPYSNLVGFMVIVLVVILCSFLIWTLNYYITFKTSDISLSARFKLSLSLAIFTAPYLFLFPTFLIYNFR